MSESDDTPDALRARAEALERKLQETMANHATELIRAELKAEAVRAGMVDLDGLKLVDPAGLMLSDGGDVVGARELMTKLRRAKPWLFGSGSTSSSAQPPPAGSSEPKRAVDMSYDEWRSARAAMLKRI